MTNPEKIPDDEHDPVRRSASPEEPQDSLEANQKKAWRERYPGWETFHGKPNDPGFSETLDHRDDARFNTNQRTESALPNRAGFAFWIWLLFLGIVVMVLLGLAFYLRYPKKIPRSPEQTRVQTQPASTRDMSVVVADSLLPLRARHRQK